MDIQEYGKMAEMENYYWWHIGRKSILQRQLTALNLPPKSRILNVGCGTGGTVDILNKFGNVVNIDTSEAAIKFSADRGIGNLVKVEGINLPFDNSYFDLVVGLDVLEHISDDKNALAEWQRVLKEGGYLLLTVPAYQWLWSKHDESLHHYRRYNKQQIARLTTSWKTLKRSHIVVFAFLPIVFY